MFGCYGIITCCCKSYHKDTVKFSSNPTISFSRKSTRKDPPVKSDQNKAISVHVLWVSFHHRSTPVLSSSHQKINFLHYISVTAVKCTWPRLFDIAWTRSRFQQSNFGGWLWLRISISGGLTISLTTTILNTSIWYRCQGNRNIRPCCVHWNCVTCRGLR